MNTSFGNSFLETKKKMICLHLFKSARFTALTSNKQNSNISGCLQQYDNTTNDNNLPFISSTCNGLLTESQYFETHPVFQDHLLKLCSFYKSLGKPIHLFNRLLHDSGVTYAYWPIYQGENDKEQQQQQREEQEREKESVQHITTDSKHSEIFIPINFNSTDHQTTTTDNVNTTTTTATTTNSDEPTTTLTVVNKISKKLSNYIVGLCNSHRLVMIQANCSPEWDKEVSCLINCTVLLLWSVCRCD